MFVSHTNTRQDTRQKVTHYGSANQEFADASVCRNKQKGVLITGVPSPLSPIPLPFSLSSYHLPLPTPATQARNIVLYENLAPVVQTLDSAIHRINHYPVDSVIGFPNTYPLDSDLSGG